MAKRILILCSEGQVIYWASILQISSITGIRSFVRRSFARSHYQLNDREVDGEVKSVVHYEKEGYVIPGQRFDRQGHTLKTNLKGQVNYWWAYCVWDSVRTSMNEGA